MRISPDFLAEVISPYIVECRYLKEAELEYPEARGRFEIPAPFYCPRTRHFNAVELFICYNQLAYVMFAEAGRQGLVKEFGGVLNVEGFKEHQKFYSFIAKISGVKFREVVDPAEFNGRIRVDRGVRRDNTVFLQTDFGFGNEGKREGVTGSVLLAITFQHDLSRSRG